jgi:drug/metabolite transporter (DMT)-like permease
MQKLTLVLLSISAVSAAAGQLLLKKGADGKEALLDFFNAPLVIGLMLYALGVVIWVYVLSQEKLVNVYAFTALTFVLVYLGGAVILHEQVSRAALVGIALILAGLYLIVNFNSQV